MFGHVKGAFTNANKQKTGWFEVANGGTIFLDEIANLNLEKQAKLLSVIQRKEITPVGSTQVIPLDIRIISATNANLSQLITGGKFREDLLYRLNTIQVALTALKEIKEDIPILLNYYLEKFKFKYRKERLKITQSILKRLQNYSWLGNIRKLKHTIERAVIMSENDVLSLSDIYQDHQTNKLENTNDNLSSLNLERNEIQLIRLVKNLTIC